MNIEDAVQQGADAFAAAEERRGIPRRISARFEAFSKPSATKG